MWSPRTAIRIRLTPEVQGDGNACLARAIRQALALGD